MKKILATLLALSALSVSALAAAEAAPETETKPAAQTEQAEVEAKLTEDEAVAAALAEAGVSEADVTVTRTRLREKTDDNGESIPVYTVRFHNDETSWKIHVNGDTGAIIDVTESEYDASEQTRGDRSASGEMGGKASDEAETVTGESGHTRSGRGSGRTGRGAETETVDTETVNA